MGASRIVLVEFAHRCTRPTRPPLNRKLLGGFFLSTWVPSTFLEVSRGRVVQAAQSFRVRFRTGFNNRLRVEVLGEHVGWRNMC